MAENGNGNGHRILPLEIVSGDDEHESLIHEITMDEANNDKDAAHGMRRRWGDGDGIGGHEGVGVSAFSRGNAMIQGLVRSDLIVHAVYHLRNAFLLAVLAFFVLVVLEWEGGLLRSEQMAEVEPLPSPHSSFGGNGKNKPAGGGQTNYGPAKKPYDERTKEEEMADLEAEILDDAVSKTGAWDISQQNQLNEEGHYLHDPKYSPYSSGLYGADQELLDEQQKRFTIQMNDTLNTYGVWNKPSFEGKAKLDDEFYGRYHCRDVEVEDFPADAWQKDVNYLKDFLDQAQALVEATKEGIMREYNHMNPDDDEKNLFQVIIGEHDFVNGTAFNKEDATKQPGIAYLPQESWLGLIRKLLHTMITTDHFYVVVAGTTETYAGNNFQRTQVMQFNYIMEPIFKKLGMTLISRNMGTSISPIVSALGGADIYGETDILWHVQKYHAEEEPGEFDLLQKQVIMSGERIPVILSPSFVELVASTKGKAWVGNIQPGTDVCQPTTMDDLPDAPACHGVQCSAEAWENGDCHVYDSVCWEPRSDFTPHEEQDEHVGHQDDKYPGFRRHQLEGRKMSLLILHALTSALDLWQEKLEDDRNPLPLPVELWHVGETYMDIRKSVMSTDRTPGESAAVPACEMFMSQLDPRICHIPMHAFTEWTPRVIPSTQRLSARVNNLVEGDDGEEADAYEGPDILPLAWQRPDDEFDVHMVAIAANVSDGYDGYDDDAFANTGTEYTEDDWSNDDDFARRLATGAGSFAAKLQIDEATRMRRRSLRYKLPKLESFTGKQLEIAAGSGWSYENVPIGFCDGSAQSRCNRRKNSTCLLANYNHYRGSLLGTPDTGWLTMNFNEVTHGIILARIEIDSRPNDLMFDYAINGQITSLNKKQLAAFEKPLVDGLTVYPLLLDKDATPDNGDYYDRGYDVAIRIRSGAACKILVSHIYYA